MSVTESFVKAHIGFLGTPPTTRQVRVYESFPTYRGVSSQELDSEIFTAVLILSLVQTYPKGRQPEPFKTYLFVRGSALAWASKELTSLARRMFDHLKEQQKVPRAKHLGTFFHAVSMGSRVLSFQTPPRGDKEDPGRWSAFGFEHDDPTIPEWVRVALLLEDTPWTRMT